MPSSLVRERQPQVWRVRKMGAPEPVLSLPKDLAFETCELGCLDDEAAGS
jgi:hypothetical protein